MEVEFTKQDEKQIKKAPRQVAEKLGIWVKSVKLVGIEETRKIKSFHDEPLKGAKSGRRSIRLNKQW